VIALETFHAINGIRLMFQQGGLGIGTPTRPDYPYQIQSMGKKIDYVSMLQWAFQH